ncbi:MAG: DnaJ domain-containing protein [Clostridia bacterium]|nr:DnaJ domain-containing protein [Deltaproteobacteria bacterium]
MPLATDLTSEERAAIEEAERKARGTHWEALGLTGSPSSADIKRAYFAVSKLVHPDRFYGKQLGDYAARLQALFVRMKRAHDVLADPTAREKYIEKHPPPEAAKTPEELDREIRIEERRKEAVDEQKAKRGASARLELAHMRMKRLADTVDSALAAGDKATARANVEQLIAGRPADKATWILEARVFEAEGKKSLAIERYRSAQRLDPTDADVRKAIDRLAGRT